MFTQRFLRSALGGMLAVLLVAGLYPFNFFPKNEVAWLNPENGVRFYGYGQVYGATPLELRNHAGPDEFSLEFLVSSHEGAKRSVESLLSVQRAHTDKYFAIERWTEDLVVAGWFRDSQGKTSFERLFCGHLFATRATRVVTVTSDGEGTVVYAEGTQQRRYPGLVLTPENFDGTLLLGQSPSGHQEWRGEIVGLAIYNKALSPEEVVEDDYLWRRGGLDRLRARASEVSIYPFTEQTGAVVHNHGSSGGNLDIPTKLHALRPVVLKSPDGRHLANWSDMALNLLGFIPFTAFLAIYLERGGSCSKTNAVTGSILIGALISLIIELLQVYLPSRDSSLLDLLMNALGSGMGATLGAIFSSYRSRAQSVV